MHKSNRTLLEEFPWHITCLGRMGDWPVEMRAVIDAIMATDYPICTGWGEETIQIYNDAYNDIFGAKHPDSFGAPLRESWPEIWPFVSESLSQVRETGEPFSLTDAMLPLIKTDAPEECYFHFSYSAIKDLTGDTLGVMAVAHETTREVVARRRNKILELTPRSPNLGGMASFSDGLRDILAANEKDCHQGALFWLSSDNGFPLETEWTIRCENDFVDAVRPAVAACLSRGGQGTFDLPAKARRDGAARQGCLIPIADKNARLVGALLMVPNSLVKIDADFFGFAELISQKVHTLLHAAEVLESDIQAARDKMTEQSAMYRFLFENIRDGAIYTATDGDPHDSEIILAVNRRASEMLGYDPEEVVGMQREAFFFPDDASVEAALAERGKEGFVTGELTFKAQDGQPMPMGITSNLFNLPGGEARSITIIRDLTAQKKQEREREDRVRMEALANLTRAIAHDFNNLLTVVLGGLDMLEERLSEDDPNLALIHNVTRAAEEAGNLTNQIITYSRPSRRKVKTIEVEGFLQEIRPLLESALGAGNTLAIRAAGASVYCRTDPSILTSGLLNLATNARQAMPKGGTLFIGLSELDVDGVYPSHDGYELPASDYLAISVSDTGMGISENVRGKIFEPFVTTKAVGEGTGLGLPIFLDGIREAGGDLRLSAETGDGAAFQVLLPRVSSAEATSNGDQISIAGNGEVILYVEDNAHVRAQTEVMLKELNFVAIVARHARDALAIARSDVQIDMVLTDVVMPGGMSGHALARELADIRPDLPVVMTSGYDPEVDTKPANTHAFLPKPYSRDELGDVMVRNLGREREE
ncbi:PAS domain S-box protein [Maritimibacter harenae]|nr:PAS domain S-box protein [Maritimibacter harenae]